MISNLEEYISKVKDFQSLSKTDIIDYFAFYLLEFQNNKWVKAKDIDNCFKEVKIPPYSNINRYLWDKSKKIRGKSQKFIKDKDWFYSLSRYRIEELRLNIILDEAKIKVHWTLRGLLEKLTNKSEKDFLEEAIKTFEVNAFRASILMVRLTTIDHLYEYILAKKIGDFIIALKKVQPKLSIITKDDFSNLKESQFIEICRSANIISNDVRKILDEKLWIRNSFAHPSTIHLPQSKALEFIEDLVNNIILKY